MAVNFTSSIYPHPSPPCGGATFPQGKVFLVDSLFCGKATPVASVHRTLAKSRLSSPLPYHQKSSTPNGVARNGLAFLRKSHAGCKCPLDTCQEPAFESTAVSSKKLHPKWGGAFLATRNGLEPSTSSVTGWRANRLHHRAMGGTACIIADFLPFVKT